MLQLTKTQMLFLRSHFCPWLPAELGQGSSLLLLCASHLGFPVSMTHNPSFFPSLL